MQIIQRFLVVSILACVFFFNSISIVHAQTDVVTKYLSTDQTWTSSSSPYILHTSVTVPAGRSLTIEQGVEVISLATSTYGIFVDGNFRVAGTIHNPVTFKNISGIVARDDSRIDIAYGSIDSVGGIKVLSATAVISSTTVQHAIEGVYSFASDIKIDGSIFTHNAYGVRIHDHDGDISWDTKGYATGGIGNAFEDISIAPVLAQAFPYYPHKSGSVLIRNSTFKDNTQGAIDNVATTTVDARYNWWGSDLGPKDTISGPLYGLVDYVPWLDHDPHVPVCCSNILFIPGIEGTRLYSGRSSVFKKLWEPVTNSDVTKLYLNSFGSSTDPSIYSGLPIDKGLGVFSVYDSFLKFLNSLSLDKTINGWKGFGYDWRKSVPDVVLGREQKATTTESLIETVQALASSSKTGKVSIVAHSNGGLIASYLVKVLSERGNSDLLDKVINVATPSLGTPDAIGALLHGSNQAIAKGYILNEKTARGLAINMPSMYSLLPSMSYFEKVHTPTIVFSTTTGVSLNKNKYASSTGSFVDQAAFIMDIANTRKVPLSTNISSPIKGNSLLMASAEVVHTILDSFMWPKSIARWALVGWNIPTTKTIQYTDKVSCTLGLRGRRCTTQLEHHASTTSMGDGVVVSPSATHGADDVVSLDLNTISRSEKDSFTHATVLESVATQDVIRRILIGKANATTSFSRGVSYGEPDYSKEATFLVIKSTGPVDLHVYDDSGSHTGMTKPPPDILDDVLTTYDDTIPGSTYSYSSSDNTSTIYVPNTGTSYGINLQGNAVGLAELNVQTVQAGQIIDQTSFVGIPVTPLSSASTTVLVGNLPVASSTPPLIVDSGFATSTILIQPNAPIDPLISLDVFKKCITRFIGNSKHGKDLIDRMDRLSIVFKKGKIRDNGKEIKESHRIGHRDFNRTDSRERDAIVNDIEDLIDQAE